MYSPHNFYYNHYFKTRDASSGHSKLVERTYRLHWVLINCFSTGSTGAREAQCDSKEMKGLIMCRTRKLILLSSTQAVVFRKILRLDFIYTIQYTLIALYEYSPRFMILYPDNLVILHLPMLCSGCNEISSVTRPRRNSCPPLPRRRVKR